MPKLIGVDWDEQLAFEIKQKGWCSLAELRMDDGRIVPLNFYDPIRLQQEIQADLKRGKPYFAEPNLIVVPEVSQEAIRSSVETLLAEGYFD